MSTLKIVMTGAIAAVIAAPLTLTPAPARADEAGAFIGGIAAARIGQNMRARTRAEQEQAYYAQQQAQQAQQVQQAPPPPAQKTTQQKLEELDALAAGGYITPEQYKAKKQQIIDSM